LYGLRAVSWRLFIWPTRSGRASSDLEGPVRLAAIQEVQVSDQLGSPSHELKTLTKGAYEKVAGSRAIGRYLGVDNARSPSFRNLIGAIRRMEDKLLLEAE
jgi:hypothetical protein